MLMYKIASNLKRKAKLLDLERRGGWVGVLGEEVFVAGFPQEQL